MENYVQILIAGISTGSIYGLVALAFVIIYNSTKIVNFAQGEFVMMGGMMAFLGLTLMQLQYGFAFLLILGVMMLLAVAFRYVLVSPLQRRNAPLFSIIVGTIAFGTVVSEGIGLLLGKQPYGVPPIIENRPVTIGSVSLLPQNLFIIVIAFLLVAFIWFFFNRTFLGRSLRAVGINPDGAKVCGIKVAHIQLLGFVISAIVSGIAGMLVAPIVGASPYIGLSVAVKGFAAAILGGMGNIYAGMIGGIIIGIAEAFGSYYISSYAEAIAYIVMLVMLLVRPTGLFPERT